MNYPENLPLYHTALIDPEFTTVLGIARHGRLEFAFPRGCRYKDIKDMAEAIHGCIYMADVRTTYELLGPNRYYDTSPKVVRL